MQQILAYKMPLRRVSPSEAEFLPFHTMEEAPFRLLDLPEELILSIVKFVVQPLSSTETCPGEMLLSGPMPATLTPLRLSCKTLRRICNDPDAKLDEIFLASNNFRFQGPSDLGRIVRNADARRLAQIQSIAIEPDWLRNFAAPCSRSLETELRAMALWPMLRRAQVNGHSIDFVRTPTQPRWVLPSPGIAVHRYAWLGHTVFSRLPVLRQGVVLRVKGALFGCCAEASGSEHRGRVFVTLVFESNDDGTLTEVSGVQEPAELEG